MGIIYRRALESGSGKWWHDHGGDADPRSASAITLMQLCRRCASLSIRILVEPGRFLVGNAGVLLTRVRYIKQTGAKKFAIVDAGMNDLIRPALYQSYHEIVPVIEPNKSKARKESILSGRYVSRAISLRSTEKCPNCTKAICSRS